MQLEEQARLVIDEGMEVLYNSTIRLPRQDTLITRHTL